MIGLRGIVGGAAIAISTVALTGCAGQQDGAPLNLPPKNVSLWAMPLDPYIPVSDIAADYAENLLMTPCMQELGYAWEVPWRDVNADHGPTWNDVSRRLFNVDVASSWGYHTSSSTDAGLAAWKEFVSQPVSDEMANDIITCREKVRVDVPRLDPNAQLANGLVGVAYEAALESQDVIDAAATWRECMVEEGVADLPEAPADMPSPSLAQLYELEDFESKPTREEVQVAVADAECRDSSGYVKAAYDAEWDRQAELLRENADALADVATLIEDNRQTVLGAISANAPAKP